MAGRYPFRTSLMALATLSLLAGCGAPPLYAPRYHGPTPTHYHVRRGDTLYTIGQRFGVDHRKIARWNDIDDPAGLTLGQRLRLRPPEGAEPEPSEPAAGAPDPPAEPETKHAPRVGKVALDTAGLGEAGSGDGGPGEGAAPGRWRWPVTGEVIRGFAPDGAEPNNGIDIAAPGGAEVVAAAEGRVVYSGAGLRGYGNLVIIRHGGGYLTTYAYNRENLVAEEDEVAAGDTVARVGQTGAATRTALHFEVRRRTQPVDPLEVLPAR